MSKKDMQEREEVDGELVCRMCAIFARIARGGVRLSKAGEKNGRWPIAFIAILIIGAEGGVC